MSDLSRDAFMKALETLDRDTALPVYEMAEDKVRDLTSEISDLMKKARPTRDEMSEECQALMTHLMNVVMKQDMFALVLQRMIVLLLDDLTLLASKGGSKNDQESVIH